MGEDPGDLKDLRKRKTGTERDELIMMSNRRCCELIRDYSLLLES